MDIQETLLKEAEDELDRRQSENLNPALIALKTTRQQASEKRKNDWKDKTRRRYHENQRHPYQVEAHPQKPTQFQHASKDTLDLSCSLFETTGSTDYNANVQLINQIVQGLPQSGDVHGVNGAIAMLNGIAPENPLEGLLAGQMVTIHSLAMEFARRSMLPNQSGEAIERNINRTTKLMRTFTAQVEALNKLRTKGQQKITVQHVQVNQGGQAIVGDVHRTGREEG